MFRFRFLGLRTVFYRTHIDNSSLWTEVIYILYKYSINNNNNKIIKGSVSPCFPFLMPGGGGGEKIPM